MSQPASPPFTVTSTIIHLVAEVAGLLGKIEAFTEATAVPQLRRENRLRTIHASLAIENNTPLT